MVTDDFAWLRAWSSSRDQLPKEASIEHILSFLQGKTRNQWYNTIKRAAHRARRHRSIVNSAENFRSQFSNQLLEAGIFYNVHAKPVTASSHYVCSHCGADSYTLQGIRRHMATQHQMYHEANLYISGTFCRGCLKDFHSRNNALRHMKTAKFCLNRCRTWLSPQSHVQEVARSHKDSQSNANHKIPPPFRFSGPKLPKFSAEVIALGNDIQALKKKLKSEGLKGKKVNQHPAVVAKVAQMKAYVPPAPVHSIGYVEQAVEPPMKDHLFDIDICPFDFAKFIRPSIVILHLFSGRRRPGDLQDSIEKAFQSSWHQVIVISLDVVYGQRGDLTNADNQNFWRCAIRSGKVIGFVAGPPCESWSIARFRPGGPPPLRSQSQLWGLTGLSFKQYMQIEAANLLLQTALFFASEALLVGACGVIEHPALIDLHQVHSAPSIWQLPDIDALRLHSVVDLTSFKQGALGARSLKPTTMLTIRLPHFADTISASSAFDLARCIALEGHDDDGNFRTAAAKEYPEALNVSIAKSFRVFVDQHGFQPAQPCDGDTCFDAFTVECQHFFVPIDPYLSLDIGADFAPSRS